MRIAFRTRASAILSLAITASLGGCAAVDEQIASDAKADLVGMSALDVQTCLGLPDQRLSVGDTTLLTYVASATRSVGLSAGLVSLSFGGYCHATIRIEKGRVSRVEYSGATESLLGRDAACAPIVRTCLRRDHPRRDSISG